MCLVKRELRRCVPIKDLSSEPFSRCSLSHGMCQTVAAGLALGALNGLHVFSGCAKANCHDGLLRVREGGVEMSP